MIYKISVIRGDGIGPEIIDEAQKVLDRIGRQFGHEFKYVDILMGGASIDVHGVPLTDNALMTAKESDSVLLGAVGGDINNSGWYKLPPERRPEAGLLAIRKGLNLYCNLRPAILFDKLLDACPLKEENISGGFDIMVVRELTGGVYFGSRKTYVENGIRKAVDTMPYDEDEIKRIAVWAFEAAMKRNKRVCSVDKANVLDTSRLWREVVKETAALYPDVELTNMLVDNCAMQLVKDPKQFDVILTENMFGDILSDEASMLTGSIGMLASASLGQGRLGLYEPIHGSAPDIAGQDKANPIAAILSAGMMLKYSFGLLEESEVIEAAIRKVLDLGYRTIDIMSEGLRLVGTKEMGDLICNSL